MQTNKEKRKNNLLPLGVPRYIRVYDNGDGNAWFCRKTLLFSDNATSEDKRKLVKVGEGSGSHDRYTVVFTGNYAGREGCDYIGMSSHPSHPQGYGQHGWDAKIIDAPTGFPPKVGDKDPFGGRRITFAQLPPDCQHLVLSDYSSLWGI